MKKTLNNSFLFFLLIALYVNVYSQERIKPEWKSISKYPTEPEWLADAKFGIYTHWTLRTVTDVFVPNYPPRMYLEGQEPYEYHKIHFGDQKDFGLKDFIPLFKAPKFDAQKWADVFEKAGAKFAGPVAVHHDNFAMWNSKATKWNSVDMGPKRDITGELALAIKQRGMRLITTMHHSWAWGYNASASMYDGVDPDTWQLYGEPRPMTKNGIYWVNKSWPTKRYLDQWLEMIHEVIHHYAPDMLWFDIAFDGRKCIPPEYQKQMFADYYNWALDHEIDVTVGHKEMNLLKYSGIRDYERGRSEILRDSLWMTDATMSRSWFYHPEWVGKWKKAGWIIDMLCDIVSKNGVLLLNIAPKPDGTLPEEGTTELLKVGEWLQQNGEAIYETRPWKDYGEPHKKLSEHHGRGDEKLDRIYSSKDVRFTRSKDSKTIYAIVMGWPGNGKTKKIKALNTRNLSGKIKNIQMLGIENDLIWNQDEHGLEVKFPDNKPNEYAYALKIRLI